MSSSIICLVVWYLILLNEFLNEINCKKSFISNTVCGRRHPKLFTNCHVSWDTLYLRITVATVPRFYLSQRLIPIWDNSANKDAQQQQHEVVLGTFMQWNKGLLYCTVQVLCTTINKTFKIAHPPTPNKRSALYYKG